MIIVNLHFLFRLFILSLALVALFKCFSVCLKPTLLVFATLLAIHLIWHVRFIW